MSQNNILPQSRNQTACIQCIRKMLDTIKGQRMREAIIAHLRRLESRYESKN